MDIQRRMRREVRNGGEGERKRMDGGVKIKKRNKANWGMN